MMRYDAFISYSHAKDKPIAAALQSAIQKLGKPWYRRRALDTLLIGLTDGGLVWDNSAGDFFGRETVPLPDVLAKRFPSEPKWVDLRPYREGADRTANKRDAKFTELAADFAAAIRGTPKEDLLSQEVRQQRRALTLAWSAAASLLILAVMAAAAGVVAYREEQEAVAQRNRAEQALTASTKTANSLVFDLAQRFKPEPAGEANRTAITAAAAATGRANPYVAGDIFR